MSRLTMLRSKARALAPALLLIVFLAAVKIVIGSLRLQTGVTDLSDARAVAEFGARLGWGVAIVVLVLAVVWTTAVAFVVICRCSSVFYSICAFLVACIIGLGLSARFATSVGRKLLETAAISSGIPVATFANAMNAVAAGTVAIVVVACVTLTWRKPLDIAQLRVRIFQSRLLLYSAAFLLVAGVAEIYFLFAWPRYVLTPNLEKAVQNAGQELTAGSSILYSILLLAAFVPVGVIHEVWSSELTSQTASPTSESAQHTATQLLSELLAIASPVLTGVLLHALRLK